MKKDIHPELHQTIIIDTSSGFEFKTLSTKKGEETREEDGVVYNILKVEVSSASHPFFTGKQTITDTARRVEKFEKQKQKFEEKSKTTHRSKQDKQAARKAKKQGNVKEAKQDAKEALKAAKSALKGL